MYNLLMQASWNQNEWELNEGSWYDVSHFQDRLFEFTDQQIIQRFKTEHGPDFPALMRLPCLFTYEGEDVVGRMGRITDVRTRGSRLGITYSLSQSYPRVAMDRDSVFEALDIGTGRSFERSRTHWAVKDIDLFEYTTTMLQEQVAVSVAPLPDDMLRIWGSDHKKRALAFLSHRAQYRSEVARVKQHLESHGVRCFVAHEDIIPTLQWQAEITHALNSMELFIGFVTSDFHEGAWTDQEIGCAYQRGVLRIFVKLGDNDPAGMVAREQALTAGWDTAAERILEQLKESNLLSASTRPVEVSGVLWTEMNES